MSLDEILQTIPPIAVYLIVGVVIGIESLGIPLPGEIVLVSGALLARVGGKGSTLEVLGSDQPPASTPLPAGPIATSLYGDLVAVASDTAVFIYDPLAKQAPRVMRVSGHARDVIFSPSGHRLYIAKADGDIFFFLQRDLGPSLPSHLYCLLVLFGHKLFYPFL